MGTRVHRFSRDDAGLLERFLALRERIYADDYFFYPDADQHRELIEYYSRRPDYSFTLLLAEAPSGEDLARMVVGRQAGLPWAFFGLFESVDNPDVFAALTAAAREIARDLGADQLVGPWDFNALHGWMFQLDAAGRERWVGDLYHCPYAPDLFRRAGWVVADEAVSGVLHAAEQDRLSRRFAAVPDRLRRKGFQLVRRFDLPDEDLLRLIWSLVGTSFTAGRHRYVPVEYEFFRATQLPVLRRLCEAEGVVGFLKDGALAAYGTAFANFIDDLCNPGGTKRPPPNVAREPPRYSVHATAVAPAYRGGILLAGLTIAGMRHAEARFGQPMAWRRTGVHNPGTTSFRDLSEILWRHVTFALPLA